MLDLTQEDECALRSIAHELSHSQEEGEATFETLYEGFSLYSDADLVAKHPTREAYFCETAQRLIENIGDAGKSYKEACDSLKLREMLSRIVRSLGVSDADVEDITQEVDLKAWRYRWMEDYNPTRSALPHYLYVMVRNHVRSRHERESHRVTYGASRLDETQEEGRNPGTSRLYSSEGGECSPEERLDTAEILEQWANYLDVQAPFRVKLNRGFQYLCTLLPPGTEELPTDQEMTLFWIGGKIYNSRVTTWELYDQGISHKVHNRMLADYISVDPITRDQLWIPGTDEWVCQKNFPNPEYDHHAIPVREQRNLKEIFLFLRDGWQIDEIGRWYRTPPTSVPAWIQRLEQCFLNFLVVCDLIPRPCKLRAVQSYQCPSCRRLWYRRRETCPCGCDMRMEMASVRFNEFPWERAYATRETQERLGTRRAPLEVMRGSLV